MSRRQSRPNGSDGQPRVLVAQIGARRRYSVPRALYESGMLESFHTDWCANRGLFRVLTTLLPRLGGPLNRIHDRQVPTIPSRLIRSHFLHAVRMAGVRRNVRLSNDEYWARANAEFGRQVVQSGFGQATAVYGFNAAARELFSAARDRGLTTILDQTMAAWSVVGQTLEEERARWPDWSIPASEGTSADILAAREAEEWDLADLIICGSQYVFDSLRQAGASVTNCRIVPYGYDGVVAGNAPRSATSHRLRVLFVGTVDLRKGVPYLLEAAHALDRTAAEFRMVGPVQVSESALNRLRKRIDVTGPVPRSEVPRHYQWADIFVLPTLAEGSANVCFEAMSHGLPVITTSNAGSVVRDSVDGWIVPPRSSEAILGRLQQAVNDRQQLQQLSENALARVAEFTAERYMESLAATIQELLEPATVTADTSVPA